MIATSHVLIGAAAGTAVGIVSQNPVLALAAGFVSHLLADSLPHWDHPDAPKINGDLVFTKKVYIFAITDSLVAFFLILFLWWNQGELQFFHPLAWGALGGYLPDFMDNVPLWRFQIRTLPGFRHFHKLHEWIHLNWMGRYPMPEHWVLGTITQIITVLPALWFIISKN
jgi:hypothetical protein